MIELNVPERSLQLLVSDEELALRRAAWQAPPLQGISAGYGQFFVKHVRQANDGCDFDFLESGPPTLGTFHSLVQL
jgi:dihydroxy-acid dehydratase